MSNILRCKDKFVSDMLRMLEVGSTNDVKIILEDGEIFANKDVLSARCDYFATCFSNKKFIEGNTNTIDLSHCSKVIMEKIVHYLFIGEVDLQDLSLIQLINLMNMATMMLLDELLASTENFVLGFTLDSEENFGPLPLLVKGLILAEQFKLTIIKDALVLKLHRIVKSMKNIPNIPNSDAFKSLPVNLLKEILRLGSYKFIPVDDGYATTKDKFDLMMFWLSGNEGCTLEDRREISDCFNFDDYTTEELLTDVKTSGIYSVKRIDDRVLENIRLQKSKLVDVNEKMNKLEKNLSDKRNEIKTLKEENKRLKARVNENGSPSSTQITKPCSIFYRPTGWLERKRQATSRSNLTESIKSHPERIDTVNEPEVAKDLDQMKIEKKPEPKPPKYISLAMYKKRKLSEIDPISSSMRIGVGGLSESEDEPLSLGRGKKIVKK